jgi:carbonic anhydrase
MNTSRIMQILLAVALIATCVCQLPADQAQPGKPGEEPRPSPDEALRLLKEGNARFVADQQKLREIPSKQRIALAKLQRPIAVILSCSDARAVPEIVFDNGLGALFVVRVAGNVGGPAIYASMEYAITELQTPLIVVLGHSNCGAIGAALKAHVQPSENLKHLVDLINTGNDLPADKVAAVGMAVRNNVLHQTRLVTSKSEILQDFAVSGRIKIVPAVYDLHTGVINWLEVPKVPKK